MFVLLYYRASEADITPAGNQARIRLIIDGLLSERDPIDLGTSDMIIQYLKKVADMDVEDRRHPQQGKISVDIAGTPMDVVLTTAGTTGGQRINFCIVQEAVRTSLDELGLSKNMLERLRAANAADNGLIIASGRPQSGVTSTLYSLLREHDAFIKQLATLEKKSAADMENITQKKYDRDGDLSQALAAMIRPIRELSDFWAVVVWLMIRSSVVTWR